MKNLCGYSVEYKGNIFFLYAINSSGRCKLLTSDGFKHSGTPMPDRLTLLKRHELWSIGHHFYAKTKLGYISLSTGNIVNTDWFLGEGPELVRSSKRMLVKSYS